MKILFLCVRDTGGTAYTLAHAINKITPENQAVNVVGQNTFINYPIMADMGDYSPRNIREMAYNSDVIIFLGAVYPFFEKFRFQQKHLKDKKKILLCMGSEWRYGRDKLQEQADKMLKEYKVVLGGADMFVSIDAPDGKGGTKHFDAADENEVGYLPVVRSFEDIQLRYGIDKRDEVAVESFGVPSKKVTFVHAPTSELTKGSHLFYRACTQAQQVVRNLVFQSIRQQNWATTLSILAKSDVLYDQAPPFPTAYGALSVEAGIFRLPAFSQVAPECRDFILRHTGLRTPHIAFTSEEDLFMKTVQLAQEEKLRREFGQLNYDYCRQLHDEKPVVDRFMKILEDMD